MHSTLIDNSENLKLVDTLKKLISIPDITHIDIATGYWDIPGTQLIAAELRAFLERSADTRVRILIGKDPYLFAQYSADVKYKDAGYPQDFIKTDLADLKVKSEYIPAVQLLLDFCKEQHKGLNDPKIEIRIFRGVSEDDKRQFFHSKCYILYDKSNGTGAAYGIIGSSNFTQKGLQENSELNYLETLTQIISAKPDGINLSKGHITWFNEKWALASDWTQAFLEEVLKKSEIAHAQPQMPTGQNPDELTPYECYIKLLQDKFGMLTDTQFKSILTGYLPESIQPLEYQLSAVQQCYSYMLQHGGFALGDVVGLGKTIVGILIAKYFIEIAKDLERSSNVLVIAPPAIASSWKHTIRQFDQNRTDKIETHITIMTTGSLNHLFEASKQTDNTLTPLYSDEENERLITEFDFSAEDMSDAEDIEIFLTDKTPAMNVLSSAVSNQNKGISAKDKQQSDEIYTHYGLILIDESHKFRNNNTEMYKTLMAYLETVHVQTGYYPFIGLISATIQNNSPRDIQNQLYLFEHEPKKSSFEKIPGRNLEEFFSTINRNYTALIRQKKESQSNAPTDDNATEKERREALIRLSQEVREKVLSDILVRRTRTDIKEHYNSELGFPIVHGPDNLYYSMDTKLAALFNDTMNIIAPSIEENDFDTESGLGYYRYRAITFLDPTYETRYSGRNMTAQRASNQLARIMQILLVKRLESSFAAFKESLKNFQRYTQNMITMWEANCIFICPQIDVNKELNITEKQANNPDKIITLETCFDDIRKKIKILTDTGCNTKKQNAEYTRAHFQTNNVDGTSYIDYVKADLQKITALVNRWDENDYDPKLDRFKDTLKESNGLFCKERNKPHKLVIFSEAIRTITALSRAVENITQKRPLVITAENRDNMEEIIKVNFDANCENAKQKNDYDVIITTEVLAEGINLHRANTILNYDTPWNATRLIQRIGRVNRIGSQNSDIYVYNFYPSAQGNQQIHLIQNAYTKLQAFHTMFGGDSKIFSTDEELSEGNFEKVLDGEASPQEKYIAELKNFKAWYPNRYTFIEQCTTAKEKAIVPVIPNTGGLAYFALKEKEKSGCVYVKVMPDLTTEIISSIEIFDVCHCTPSDLSKTLPNNTKEIREAALLAYRKFSTKLSKAKRLTKDATAVLERATGLINKKQLSQAAVAAIGNAIASIKKGNISLAKKLNTVLSEIEQLKSTELLIPVTEEELTAKILKGIGMISDNRNVNSNNVYIYAGFYITKSAD